MTLTELLKCPRVKPIVTTFTGEVSDQAALVPYVAQMDGDCDNLCGRSYKAGDSIVGCHPVIGPGDYDPEVLYVACGVECARTMVRKR